jgi:excisionase family DNA binding protein
MTNLFNTKESCAYLKFSKDKLYKMIKKGKIIAINISEGKHPCYRIAKSELDSYITLRQLETTLGVRCGSISEMKKQIK